MAGGLFVLPKMHKITQNSLLKKHGIFCLTFSRPNFYKKELDKPGRRRYTVANQIGKPMTKRSSPVSMPLREPRVVESRQAALG